MRHRKRVVGERKKEREKEIERERESERERERDGQNDIERSRIQYSTDHKPTGILHMLDLSNPSKLMILRNCL